jgi:hypothetical protein
MTTQYKWLPEQPTREMLIAGVIAVRDSDSDNSEVSNETIVLAMEVLKIAYHAMWIDAPSVGQEPVGEVYEQQHDGSYRAEMVIDLPIGTKLYTHPQQDQTALINQLTDELNKTEAERVRWMTMALTSQPKQSETERAPLACECIESLFDESSCDISLGYFEEIVRMVEQEHGIGD